jgi:Secretion system C-terminal sorting domain/CARDB
MLGRSINILLFILISSFAIGAEFNHTANRNLDYAVWDTNQIWLGNATFRQIDIGSKLKGPNDDTMRVFTVQTNDVRLALLFTDTSHAEPMKWRNEILDIGVFTYYGGRIGDVDRDGKNDIIYGRYVSPYYLFRARWLSGYWVVDTVKAISGANLAIDIGDADNDGYADDIIYTAGITSNSHLYWAHWNGSTFDTSRIWNGDGRNIYGIAIGNFDNSNGDSNEIVAATWGTVSDGGRVIRLRWNGSIWDTLTLWKAVDSVAFNRVAIGDFDAANPGKEIAAANGFSAESENRGAVFEIYGSGSSWYHRPIYIPTPPETTNARGIAVGDVTINNPGDEVVFSNSAGTGYKLRVVYGSGTTWSSEEITNIGGQSYCAAIGNVNKFRSLNQEITYTGDGLGVYEAEQKIINNDVGVTKIVAPAGMINFGSTVTPACSVYNYGIAPATYSVRMKIGATYDTTALVTNHQPGTAVYVNNFPSWTALQTGTLAVSCSTQMTGDENTVNDKKTDSVFVLNLDAQCVSIDEPTDTVNLGTVIAPKATIRNNGNTSQTFNAVYTITGGYSNTQSVTLGPGAAQQVIFADWTAGPAGMQTVKCTTQLAGDLNQVNDLQSDSVLVQRLDVQPIFINRPVGSVNQGDTFTPKATVRNNGNTAQSFPVLFTITDGYSNIQTVTSLSPGATTTVNFALWTATTIGSFQVRCSTGLAGDMNPLNDTLSDNLIVQGFDAQPVLIINPPEADSISPGDTITPKALIRNNGNTVATFPVLFTISDGYSSNQIVTISPGTDTMVSFNLWTANTPGSFQVRCSTGLAGDMNPVNDTLSGSVFVQGLDVQPLTIVQPTGSVNLGDTMTPWVVVKNNGNTSASFPVLFTIGDGYTDTQTVNSLGPGNITAINFALWTASTRGSFQTRCSTGLTGDWNFSNDTLAGSVSVNFIDVQTTAIIQPTGSLNLGDTITPRATFRNNGDIAQTFQVRFTINDGYSDSAVMTLLPDSQVTNNFSLWTVSLPGSFTAKCYTQLTGDMNPANDTAYSSLFVQGYDVQPMAIIQPTGIVNRGDTLTPRALIRNNGNTAVTFPVQFTIGDGYVDLQNVTVLAGSDTTVNFMPWTASTQGSFPVRCSTGLTGDMNPANDTIAGSVLVQVLDVGTTAILAPIDTVNLARIITPQAKVKNFGNTNVTFDVIFTINDSAWSSTKTVTNLNPDEEKTIDFDQWTAGPLGTLTTKCTTRLNGDVNNDNDELTGSVVVRYGWNPPAGWSRMADIPIGNSGKRPKSGSCMAGLEATGRIYFLKASNTHDFAQFTPDAATGIWTTLDTFPKGDKTLGDGKKPKKGASMAAYASTKDIYVLRGNNTPGFWKFHTDSAPGETVGWKKLANIPTGAKNPKDASGMVVITKGGNDYIFTMKGSKTDEFYLYDIAHNTWAPTPTKPSIGYSGKLGYKKGSCLCYDGTRYVYILKGTYGDMFRYDATNDSFVQLKQFYYKTFVNRLGKKKKVGEGSGIVYDNDNLYILKGGNTLEFWQYKITGDTWLQMNPAATWDIPAGSGRKVKGGGGLIKCGDCFYVAKGANTLEFYSHPLPTGTVTFSPDHSSSEGTMENNIVAKNFRLTIVPNPAKNIALVRYSLPVTGQVILKLYNVSGALIKTFANSIQSKVGLVTIDTKKIPSGVYILRFSSGSYKVTRKLVIEK